MTHLRYDSTFMLKSAAGKRGISPSELKALAPRVRLAREEMERGRRAGVLGFFDLPDKTADAGLCAELARDFRKKGFSDLLVIGIGGSDLGAKTLIRALDTGRGMCVSFLGNPDPEAVAHVLAGLDLKKTAVNVVSKSGETMEVLAVFLVIRERLIRSVGKGKHARQVVVTTGGSGALREMAEREGYAVLPVPENVGGRFSVFSSVGLFPAACAGIDVERLLAGAKNQVDDPSQSEKFASLQVLGWRKDLRVSVLMPYGEALSTLSVWYAQLLAESLGKTAAVGPTPYPALGAADQHSQLQLWMEGPADKIVTFVEAGKFRHAFRVPKAFPDILAAGALSGVDLEEIMHAERQATSEVLRDAGRPNGTIFIPTISEESVGALLQFFMQATAVAGSLLGIDAFNQPGVEAGKRLTRAILENP
ncbi:hypothetical protein A3D72_03410 [Candidatus Uhrbacteria bacterium RIFCSPHIGHO2_02_FULL_57_19]|uniref:Glucose-6-phosphate isomerase n=1 Tax=Candidatus Uhrbacteria bacterium RIFCSPHIGHO2_02_FULL_57_19 TaxID=1802391 RepID=A0A1F7U5R1_9BACT|nr:MAG: hypothetical protein A3D72_03410 [Candidatus Uhrbacteria bacterium RIFCSPHIGHO2_02_FULL_57_19]